MVIVLCGECHKELPLDAAGWVSGRVRATEFWDDHGCIPGIASFNCVCGQQLSTGPDCGLSPAECRTRDDQWLKLHMLCSKRQN